MSTPRVYSAALVVTEQPNDGYAAVYRVPLGHRWVVKAMTWAEKSSNSWDLLTYAVVVDGEFLSGDVGTLRASLIQDHKLMGQRPGEWEGRLTLDAGDALIVGNYTQPFDGTHPITVSFHGYDFAAG